MTGRPMSEGESKAEAVWQVIVEGRGVDEVAVSMGVERGTVREWVTAWRAEHAEALEFASEVEPEPFTSHMFPPKAMPAAEPARKPSRSTTASASRSVAATSARSSTPASAPAPAQVGALRPTTLAEPYEPAVKSPKAQRQRRPAWLVVGGLTLVVVALFGWLAVSWFGTYQQAQLVQREVAAVRVAVTNGEWDAVPGEVASVRDSAQELAARTRTPAWRILELLPFVGSSASAVTDLAGAVASVAGAAEPLTPFAEALIDGRIRQPDGSVDLVAMEEAAPLLDRFTNRVAASVEQLNAVDLGAVRPEVAGPLDQFRTEMADVLPALQVATDIATWLPGMLGADGERTWLIMLQNPAEARGTGGFIGGYVIATARDGMVSLQRTGTSSELAGSPIPADSAPEDARETWGDALERWGAFNVSPHFPMTAALAADGMAALGQRVDGVIAVDPRAVAAILQITGPVTALGKTITAEDAERFFTVDVYREYPDGQQRDDVTMALVEATFQALLDADWSPSMLNDALRAPIEEERVLVWSGRAPEAEWLEQTVLGGAVIDRPGSVVAVAFNNSAQNKTDAFVTASVDYAPGRCPTGSVQQSSLRVTLVNDAPADLPDDNYGYFVDPDAPRGTTRMLVHMYVPVDANYQRSTIDGVDIPLNLATERNRPVWWTYVELAPGAEHVLDVTFEEPTVLGTEPRVRPQPMVNDQVVRVAPNRIC